MVQLKPSPKTLKTPSQIRLAADKAKDQRIRSIFNMALSERMKVEEFQGGVCAVSKTLPRGGLHMDHCHKTGIVRGLLNPWINKGLSFFQDDPVLLRAAADYLENPPVTQALGETVYGVVGRVSRKAIRRRYGPNGDKIPQQRTTGPLTAIQVKEPAIPKTPTKPKIKRKPKAK